MEKFTQTNLHRQLRQEHRKQRELRPLLYLLAVLASCLGLSFISYLITPLYCYDICFYLLVVGNIAGGVIFLFSYLSRDKDIRKTAQRLDDEHAAKNRLESALELVDTEHALKMDQHRNTTEFYSEHKFSHWWVLRLTVVAIMLLLLWFDSRVLQAQQQRYQQELKQQTLKQQAQKMAEKSNKTNSSKKSSPKPPKNDKAELKLILPEAETQAKPLDEIEWQGVGKSTHGFKKLLLSVYVNGEFVKNIEPNSPVVDKQGNLKTAGFIVLDEFEVKPFDLVSYHLTGYTQINDDNSKKIISLPQFIEIRPFREDAFIAKAGDGDGKGQAMLNVLVHFLRLQTILNKATFTARIMRQQDNKAVLKEFKKLFAALKVEQHKLNNEVEAFLNSEHARKFPAEAINNIEKAQKSLNATWQQLQVVSLKEL